MQKLTIRGFLKRFVDRHRNRPDRPFCFVLGAGASKASMIPTGEELVQQWLRSLHEDEDFEELPLDEWATAENLRIPGFELERASDFYPALFDRRFPDEQDGFAFLERLMERKQPSYGYSVLAYLLSETNHKIVITTNFDNLVADALSIHAETYPRVVGNDELVRYVLPELRRPLVAKVHGDLGFAPKNRPDEVAVLSEGWKQALTRILGRFSPIFIGYSGSDGSLMSFLENLPDGTPDTVLWCYRRGSSPTERIREFVRARRGFLVEIEGFDELAMQMLDVLRAPDVPDLAEALEQRSRRRIDAYRKQRDELGSKLAEPRHHEVASEAEVVVSSRSDADSELLEAASRVLGGKSGERTWWQLQHEIEEHTDPDAIDMRYREAIDSLPGSAPLLGNYARFLTTTKKDPSRAEEYYRRALEVDPTNRIVLINYANFISQFRKDLAVADEYYLRALELYPEYAVGLCNYASFLIHEKRDLDKAEEYFLRAIEADSSDARILGSYANYLMDHRKNPERALEYFRRASEADPLLANNLGNYARALFLSGRPQQANAVLRRAEEAESGDLELRVELQFYRLAHDPSRWPSGLSAVKRLVLGGVRSPGWPLSRNVDLAEKDGHPDPLLLREIASVIADGAAPERLDRFAAWLEAS